MPGRPRIDASARHVTLSTAHLTLAVSPADGTLSVFDASGRPVLEGARAAVELEGAGSVRSGVWEIAAAPQKVADAHGSGRRMLLRCAVASGDTLLLELCVYDAHSFALLRLGIENRGTGLQRVETLTPLTSDGGLMAGSPCGAWRIYRHGWQSWTPSLSLGARQRDIDALPPVHAPADVPEGQGSFASEEVAAVLDPATGTTLLLGFVSAREQRTQVRLEAGKRWIEAVANADGAPIDSREMLWSERLLIDVSDEPWRSLETYADALGREMGARVPASVPTGWCSWYHYYREVSEADILANVAFLREHQRHLPVDAIQIDDGYQGNIGDWTVANGTFPRGMAALASDIRKAGFRPGLWLAPFLVGETSQLFAEHPDWCVRDERDRPAIASRNWEQRCYALDCTNPGAEAWLRDLFRTVTAGWGYDYVKIDFLYGGAIAGRRFDPDATRIEAYRRGLRAVREGAGSAFVLGCGALMGASAGLVDGQRIGPDVAPWWRYNRPTDPPRRRGRPKAGGEPSAENALRNTITRGWMHGRLWANDPDCLLARDRCTKLSTPEVQSLATAIALSGGMVLLGDNLVLLSPERIDLCSLLLPPLGVAAEAAGLLAESMPTQLDLEIARPFETWRLVGCFNWSGRRRTLRAHLPSGRWHAFELWEQRYHGERYGSVELADVPAHGARLLALRRPLDRPQLIGTTFHYSMGGAEMSDAGYDGRSKALRVDLQPVARSEGSVFVRAPRGYRLRDAAFEGTPITPVRHGRNVLELPVVIDKPGTLRMRFGRGR